MSVSHEAVSKRMWERRELRPSTGHTHDPVGLLAFENLAGNRTVRNQRRRRLEPLSRFFAGPTEYYGMSRRCLTT